MDYSLLKQLGWSDELVEQFSSTAKALVGSAEVAAVAHIAAPSSYITSTTTVAYTQDANVSAHALTVEGATVAKKK